MASALPEPIRNLAGQLAKLPGLGPKSAMRMVMTLLKWPEAETRSLGQAIFELRDKLCLCSRCGGLSDEDPCQICRDPQRDKASLCIVPDWDSMLTLEDAGFYDGQYFVLGGLLAPLEKVGANNLDLPGLRARLAEGEISEAILALGATIEGENTATFLKEGINNSFPAIRVTRLAQGLPLGAEVKYMDRETLRQSWRYRQPL